MLLFTSQNSRNKKSLTSQEFLKARIRSTTAELQNVEAVGLVILGVSFFQGSGFRGFTNGKELSKNSYT